MSDLELTDGELTISLPGLTAVRIDPARRLIAVDCISGSGQVGREWTVADLRDGTYGGFHHLRPAGECLDAGCATSGEHALALPNHKPEEG